jgi:hypothetical protein
MSGAVPNQGKPEQAGQINGSRVKRTPQFQRPPEVAIEEAVRRAEGIAPNGSHVRQRRFSPVTSTSHFYV